jgi:hypothetical protein
VGSQSFGGELDGLRFPKLALKGLLRSQLMFTYVKTVLGILQL